MRVLDLACDAVDQLMLTTAPGWERVAIALAPSDGGSLRPTALDVREGSVSCPVPPLGIDRARRAARLGEALGALRRALGDDGREWSGERAVCTRLDAGRLFLSLEDASGRVAATIELGQADLATGDAFLEAIAAGAPVWSERQRALEAAIGAPRTWIRDHAAGTLTLLYEMGTTHVLRVEVLGTWDPSGPAFRWAWAEPGAAHALVAASAALHEAAARWPGLGILRMPAFECEPELAFAIARLAADRLGGCPVASTVDPATGARTFFAAMGD